MTTVATTSRKVDTSRGTMRTDLSREWARRPDDQKFLSLDALLSHTRAVAERSFEHVTAIRDLRLDGYTADDRLVVLHEERVLDFSNWSFGQLCRYAGAPAGYLRTLPADLAAAALQTSVIVNGNEDGKELIDGQSNVLRALTGPKYGRITSAEVVGSIRDLASKSDVTWKVPGVMDWSTGRYNPDVPVTLETTTLFASDRDCAVFLCDDLAPIEVGKLANGDPDLMFRGIFVRNSEVGAAKLEVMTMYLRAVCANRCLWGVEHFQQIDIRHNAWAPEKFREAVLPALDSYHKADPSRVIEGVAAAREPLARFRGEAKERRTAQLEFLVEMGFSQKVAASILDHEAPGTAEMVSVWDTSQKITSFAQTLPYQDKRLELEMVAGSLLDRATGVKREKVLAD